MPEATSEQYLVRTPILEIGRKEVDTIKGRQLPTMTYMSNALIPNSNTYIEYGWIWEMPNPNPHIREHAHQHNEIVVHLGADPANPEDLGAELEFFVDGQRLVFDTSSVLFVPAGIKHTPIIWKRVSKPHLQMSITLNKGNYGYRKDRGGPETNAVPLWQKPEGYDFEKNLVRRPVRELAWQQAAKGVQSPVMTYLSDALVPGSHSYLEYSWVWDVPEPSPYICEHTHRCNQIVLFIGSDPANPEDLGAELEFTVAGQSLVIDRNAALFLPAGVKHGPVAWNRVNRPHMQMTLALDSGTFSYF